MNEFGWWAKVLNARKLLGKLSLILIAQVPLEWRCCIDEKKTTPLSSSKKSTSMNWVLPSVRLLALADPPSENKFPLEDVTEWGAPSVPTWPSAHHCLLWFLWGGGCPHDWGTNFRDSFDWEKKTLKSWKCFQMEYADGGCFSIFKCKKFPCPQNIGPIAGTSRGITRGDCRHGHVWADGKRCLLPSR